MNFIRVLKINPKLTQAAAGMFSSGFAHALTCRKKAPSGDDSRKAKRTEYHALSSREDVAARAEDTSCSLLPEDDLDRQRGLTLKRDVGLLSGITFLLGSIIGTGIFITPGNVLKNSKSIGVDLSLWALGGLNAFIGGLCAAEMGALLPSSGGDYAFYLVAGRPYGEYGDVPAFLFAWTLFFMDPATTTIQGLTFAAYVLSLPYPDCAPPYEVKVLVTCLFITFATAVNCFSVKTSTKVQDVLSGLKCAFLYAVIITGAIYSFYGKFIIQLNQLASLTALSGNHIWDSQPLGNLPPSTGDLASAMYSALYCYGGWNAINCVAEEVKNPGRNIPIAIAVSVALTATIYLLTNLAFFVVLDTDTIASADAVAVTFVRATWGQRMANVMPVVIGMTVFGTTCANVVTSSRVFFAASRQGHLARVMSYVHVDSSVPLLAMVVRCLLSLAFTLVGSVHFLIEVSILLGNVLDAASVASLLLLRRSMPDAPRPYRVPTVIAVLRLVVCLVLAAMTLVQVRRYVYQYALVAIAFATGAVYYYLFVRKKFRLRGCERIAVFLQKCFKSAPCSNELERLDDSVVVEWK
ncbi:large neutral amino acids transporter small subunit 1 [Rhipicephalus sanguineus]|uniref:large neutral amino acids transporter small subunit 1 n=1 Tax=Rhipicephalus sanguineus TaxID=34632 RepID=UPI0020C504FD|nr:large neutral amino acids transporter small subunit 1 [Rhipicephalus sanguineus]